MPIQLKCKGSEHSCIFFALDRVDFTGANCQLFGNAGSIEVVVQGQRRPGRGHQHEYELEVLQQIGMQQPHPVQVEFALAPSPQPTFQPLTNKYTGVLSSDSQMQKAFLVRRVGPPVTATTRVFIKCMFRHRRSADEEWYDLHQVPVCIEVV